MFVDAKASLGLSGTQFTVSQSIEIRSSVPLSNRLTFLPA